jgi:hypothetical protein
MAEVITVAARSNKEPSLTDAPKKQNADALPDAGIFSFSGKAGR